MYFFSSRFAKMSTQNQPKMCRKYVYAKINLPKVHKNGSIHHNLYPVVSIRFCKCDDAVFLTSFNVV